MTRYYASARDLDRDIKDGKLYPVYFFYGENDFLVREYEDRLAAAALAGGGIFGDLLCEVFYAGDDAITDIMNAAMTVPMGGAKKVVIVRGAERLKDKEVQAVAAYAQNPSSKTVMIVTARGIGKGKGPSGIAAPPADRLSDLVKVTAVAVFARARENDIREWVTRRLGNEGKEIDREALDAIVDFIGQDLSAIAMEVEKIVIFLGSEKRATLSVVEEILPYLRVHTVFELTDALSRGDSAASVVMLREVIGEGAEPTQILSIIRWHFMRLWSLKMMVDRDENEAKISRELKIPAFRLAEYTAQARRIPHGVFRGVFREFYKTDRLLKSRWGKGGVVMDKMALDITTMMRTGRYTSE
ncbi:MAG: DNA polymerase III subunit delta [Deltaproteobacteria bacterium]|nr:DNA polymerase III subunit delta [Candidatus Zymogenaceae bacterium]